MKNIAKYAALFSFFIIFPTIVFSQKENNKDNRRMKKEKIDQMKVEFLTEKLSLTSSEAEKFWKIYNEMEDKTHQERKLQHDIAKELDRKLNTLSDSELKSKTEAIFKSEMKEAQIKMEYIAKIAEVIGQKRATKLLNLENEFRRELLNMLRGDEFPPPPPPR